MMDAFFTMTTIERLNRWREAEIITGPQFETLSALVRKKRFSLYLELNALLYLGVISLVAGIGWTFTTHFERLGDLFLLGVLSSMLCASLYYCLAKAPAYSNNEVESTNMLVDYALYFGCLILSVELGYIEFRFEWLRDAL